MKTSAFLARIATIGMLLFAFGVSVYRAKTQTIAHDEALTYEWFLDQGVYDVLKYNATNHVLQTLLAKPAVKVLGVSEFTLRLPSLLGAAIYLAAIYFLCRLLFGEGLVFVLAVALLALNPQVMDFLAAARGYGLGLAGLAVAMYVIAKLTDRGDFDVQKNEWRWGCALTSVCLALSVAANFTNIVPAASLAVAFAAITLGSASGAFHFRDERARELAKYFLCPGAAVGFCILWPYLIQARPGQAYAGHEKILPALQDIFTASFLYKWTDDMVGSLGAVASMAGSWQQRVTDLGAFVIFPLLFCFVLAGLLLALRAQANTANRQGFQCRIFAGAAIGSVVLTVLLHVGAHVHYPSSRFALFLIPLFTVGGILTAREISSRFPSAILKSAGVVVAALVVFVYAESWNTKVFRYNAYDTISLRLYQAIAEDAQNHGLTHARVGGTWWYEPEINFYRRKFKANWMAEYDVKDKSYFWQSPNALEPAGYDYFVFIPASDPQLSGPGIRTIYHDEKTQATIIAIAHN